LSCFIGVSSELTFLASITFLYSSLFESSYRPSLIFVPKPVCLKQDPLHGVVVLFPSVLKPDKFSFAKDPCRVLHPAPARSGCSRSMSATRRRSRCRSAFRLAGGNIIGYLRFFFPLLGARTSIREHLFGIANAPFACRFEMRRVPRLRRRAVATCGEGCQAPVRPLRARWSAVCRAGKESFVLPGSGPPCQLFLASQGCYVNNP
jgi:hypothetical protein